MYYVWSLISFIQTWYMNSEPSTLMHKKNNLKMAKKKRHHNPYQILKVVVAKNTTTTQIWWIMVVKKHKRKAILYAADEKKASLFIWILQIFSILRSILAYQNTHIRTFQNFFWQYFFTIQIIFTIFEHQGGGFYIYISSSYTALFLSKIMYWF